MKRTWMITAVTLLLVAALTACGAAVPQKTASYISMEAAQNAALSGAGVAADAAEISAATLEEVHGITCYKVEFSADGQAYRYSVDAVTGVVVEASRTDAAQPVAGTVPPEADPKPAADRSAAGITAEQAKQIALDHAGVQEADFIKAQQDHDDGRWIYDVEFTVDSGASFTEYDYEINAATGAVLQFDLEAEGAAAETNSNVSVSAATAKQAALTRVPGAVETDLREFKLELDDGRWAYEGEIICNSMEYSFTVDANTGTVLEWEAESVYD